MPRQRSGDGFGMSSESPPRDLEPRVDGVTAAPPDEALAAKLRGFGPLGLGAILLILLTGNVFVAPMVVLPVGAVLVLLWARRSRTPWRAIGYVRPESWIDALAGGIAFG